MDKKGKKEPDNKPSDKVPDDLEEKFTNSDCGPKLEVNANPPGDEIDINHDNINQAEAVAAAEAIEADVQQADAAPLVGDEIDLLHPPVLDFHHLDNALQHVQGHMDSMMHNLGGLQVGALWGNWGGRRMLAIKSIGFLEKLTALSSQLGI